MESGQCGAPISPWLPALVCGRDGKQHLVLPDRADKVKANRQPALRRRARDANGRATRHVGECRKDGVSTRADRLSRDRRRKRLGRGPRQRRDRWCQDQIVAREEGGEPLPEAQHDFDAPRNSPSPRSPVRRAPSPASAAKFRSTDRRSHQQPCESDLADDRPCAIERVDVERSFALVDAMCRSPRTPLRPGSRSRQSPASTGESPNCLT